MNDDEKACAELGLKALDGALGALGEPPLARNSFLRQGEHMEVFPYVEVDKPGTAPIRFVFGGSLDVWIGPDSEVLLVDVSESDLEQLGSLIERVLRSVVKVTSGRWVRVISFRVADEQPWRKLRVLSLGGERLPSQEFLPFAQ